MTTRKTIGFVGLAALGAVLVADPAWAGFEWVTAPDASSYPASGVAPSAASRVPEVISPVVIFGDTTLPVVPVENNGVSGNNTGPTVPVADVVPPSSVPPLDPVKTVDKPSLATATISVPASSSAGEVVQGFASQVPLALALRQILPIGYSFSIDPAVSMDTLVSYKGGRPWRDTVRDMLAPVGLVSQERGASLSVSRQSSSAFQPVASVGSSAPVAARPSVSLASAGRSVPDLPSVSVGAGEGWSAQRGDSLHKVLTDWCRRAGVELQWLAEYDYPMEASVRFNGDFEGAVRTLLTGFELARPQPVAELHTNATAGQRLLVVQVRGNNYTY